MKPLQSVYNSFILYKLTLVSLEITILNTINDATKIIDSNKQFVKKCTHSEIDFKLSNQKVIENEIFFYNINYEPYIVQLNSSSSKLFNVS